MLDKWIATLTAGDCLEERDLKKLCQMVSAVHGKMRQNITPDWRLVCETKFSRSVRNLTPPV